MKILALDLATHVGWCVDGPEVVPPRAGAFKLRGGGTELGVAGLAFSEWLAEMVATWRPDAIAFEAPLMGGPGVVFNGRTARLLIGLAFVTEVVAASYATRCFEEHVQSVRRHFLGQGRPKDPKRATVERCRLLGWEVPDHNAADAAALWAFAKARLDRTFRLEATTPMFGRASA